MHTSLIFRPVPILLSLLLCAVWGIRLGHTAVPGVPVPRAPKGPIAEPTPTYVWTGVAGATTYHLWVADSTGPRLAQTARAAVRCQASTGRCSITSNVVLAPGKARWKVRARNAEGWGAWSALQRFTVAAPADNVQNVLETGDRYDFFADPIRGGSLFRELWRVLHESHAPCWVSQFNTLTQYQFYEDASFRPGPLYRYSGFDVSVGRLVVYNIGWYFRPAQTKPQRAAYVNAAIGDFFLILADQDTMREAFWHNGSTLVITPYHIGSQCL